MYPQGMAGARRPSALGLVVRNPPGLSAEKFSRMAAEKLGPGVVRRARRGPVLLQRTLEPTSPKPQALTLEEALWRAHNKQRAHEGQVARQEVQELLGLWTVRIGPPYHLLKKQMGQFHSEWGFERLEGAISEIAAGPHVDSFGRFRQLVKLMACWRRAK